MKMPILAILKRMEIDLEFYVDLGGDEVLASVMLNVAKDDFYASDSLTFVEIV